MKLTETVTDNFADLLGGQKNRPWLASNSRYYWSNILMLISWFTIKLEHNYASALFPVNRKILERIFRN